MARDLWTFLRAMFSEWASGVTGAASAPLFALGLYLDKGVPKTLTQVFAFLLFLYATFAVWRRERQTSGRIVSLAPRPSLLLTYDSPRLVAFPDDQSTEPPLTIHNEGHISAVNITFEPLEFNRNFTLLIRPIQMIGPLAHTSATFDIDWREMDGSRILEVPRNFAAIIFNADLVAARHRFPERGPWTLTMHYMDTNGRTYDRQYAIALDRALRTVTLTFRQ